MNKDIISGKWTQLKGQAQKQWGKLTNDDLDVAEGNAEYLAGRVQERYGIARAGQGIRFLAAQGLPGLQVSRAVETGRKTGLHGPFFLCAIRSQRRGGSGT